MLTKITIQAIFTMCKVKRGELLANSLRVQKSYLKASSVELANGNKQASQALQKKWLIERRAYKTALKIQGV